MICLSGGSLHVGNMGCRALGASLIALAAESMPPMNITLLYGNSQPGEVEVLDASGRPLRVRLVNYRMSPRSQLKEHLLWIFILSILYRCIPNRRLRKLAQRNPWIKAVQSASFLGEISGGDSFADIYGVRRFLFAVAPTVIAMLLGTPVVFLPQTYGPFKHSFTRTGARFLLRRANAVFARDRESLDLARNLLKGHGIEGTVHLCPDVGFILPGKPVADPLFIPAIPPERTEVTVGINISGLLYMGGYTRKNMFALSCDYQTTVRALIEAFVSRPGVRVLLLPHTFESGEQSDQLATRRIWQSLPDKLKTRVHVLTGNYGQSEMKGIIRQCGFFVGSRMHACIASLSQGIPTVGIAYSRKFAGVFDTVGMADAVLDARVLNEAMIKARCLEMFDHREKLTSELRQRVRLAQERVWDCFHSEIFAGLDACVSGQSRAKPADEHSIAPRFNLDR